LFEEAGVHVSHCAVRSEIAVHAAFKLAHQPELFEVRRDPVVLVPVVVRELDARFAIRAMDAIDWPLLLLVRLTGHGIHASTLG
jgi:hypothetical protein